MGLFVGQCSSVWANLLGARGALITTFGGEVRLSLATHLQNLALTKLSYVGRVLVFEKDWNPEDLLALLLILPLKTHRQRCRGRIGQLLVPQITLLVDN